MNDEYKQWKKNVDLENYLEEAISDCTLQTADLYTKTLSPSQWRQVIEARMWELAHLYEGWSD